MTVRKWGCTEQQCEQRAAAERERCQIVGKEFHCLEVLKQGFDRVLHNRKKESTGPLSGPRNRRCIVGETWIDPLSRSLVLTVAARVAKGN